MSESHDLLRKATQGFVAQVNGNSTLVEEILTRVVINCIRRYQDKVGAGVEDSVADLLATFKQKVAKEIFDIAQNWTLASKRELILFPPGCRFLYTLGTSTFAVIEQAPGPRPLFLDGALVHDHRSTENRRQFERHFLAMPYSVFVLHFRNANRDGTGDELLVNLYYAWRTAPLTSITDMLYQPCVPNMHKGLAVCRGVGAAGTLGFQTWDGAMISRVAGEAITDFWSSKFNTDLSNAWWDKDAIPEIATVDDWVRNTRENPLFILGLRFREEMTLGSMLNKLVSAAEETENDASALRHRLTDSIDSVSAEVFSKVIRYLKKTKFDRYYPKDVTKAVGDALEPVAEQIRVLAAAVEMELNRITQEAGDSRRSDHGWKRRGMYWSN